MSPLPERITAALGQLPHRAVEQADGMPTIELAREDLHAALTSLRDLAGFSTATLVTALDFDERERAGQSDDAPTSASTSTPIINPRPRTSRMISGKRCCTVDRAPSR